MKRHHVTLKVLDRVNLSLQRGKITTLIGPNGAGKSTLVKVLLGLQRRYSGKVTKAKGLKVGYVPQKLKLNQLRELLNFLLINRKKKKKRVKKE